MPEQPTATVFGKGVPLGHILREESDRGDQWIIELQDGQHLFIPKEMLVPRSDGGFDMDVEPNELLNLISPTHGPRPAAPNVAPPRQSGCTSRSESSRSAG